MTEVSKNTSTLPGTPLFLGGREWIVPSLTLPRLKKLKASIALVAEGREIGSEETLEAVCEIVHVAMTRNYPELTRAEAEELIDLENIRPLIAAIMGIGRAA